MQQINHYKNVDLISGPCSLESRHQTLETARRLCDVGVKKFRGGVWKPRTRPGGFEGIGEPALAWLSEVREKYMMDVGCEVANREQVMLCLQHDMDFIWIGARTVADPFAVQEIADTIKEHATSDQISTMEVYIKNPVCPDYDLWYGAYERIKASGIQHVSMMFRGFKSWSCEKYRNEPIWDIPLKMMTDHPEIKMYCDPSHIAGKRELVGEVADIAINTYNMRGLMIESHCNPDDALTDAKQQILPSEIPTLYIEREKKDVSGAEQDLSTYRESIDALDEEIVDKIVTRLTLCEQIAKVKADHDIPTYQSNRWNDVMKKIMEHVHHTKIPFVKKYAQVDYLIEDIFNSIHSASIEIQKQFRENYHD